VILGKWDIKILIRGIIGEIMSLKGLSCEFFKNKKRITNGIFVVLFKTNEKLWLMD